MTSELLVINLQSFRATISSGTANRPARAPAGKVVGSPRCLGVEGGRFGPIGLTRLWEASPDSSPGIHRPEHEGRGLDRLLDCGDLAPVHLSGHEKEGSNYLHRLPIRPGRRTSSRRT